MSSITRILITVGLILAMSIVGRIIGIIVWFVLAGGNSAGEMPQAYDLAALIGAVLGLFIAMKLPVKSRK